jgi:hypothetical protein
VRAPDYVEPIVGWRAWLVVDDEGEIRLSSLVYKNVWVPRCELVASCQRRVFCFPRVWRKKPSEHPAPTEACYCGIYGVRDADHAAAYLASALWQDEPLRWPLLHRAIGRVFLWGSVVESEQGWRASHAYPQRIYLPKRGQLDEPPARLGELVSALSGYGVPVKLIDGDLSMVGALVAAVKARAAAQAG